MERNTQEDWNREAEDPSGWDRKTEGEKKQRKRSRRREGETVQADRHREERQSGRKTETGVEGTRVDVDRRGKEMERQRLKDTRTWRHGDRFVP